MQSHASHKDPRRKLYNNPASHAQDPLVTLNCPCCSFAYDKRIATLFRSTPVDHICLLLTLQPDVKFLTKFGETTNRA